VLSHTSNTLQPLDVACFKPFKTTFKAYTNVYVGQQMKGCYKRETSIMGKFSSKKNIDST
jgi:hypothetical protein